MVARGYAQGSAATDNRQPHERVEMETIFSNVGSAMAYLENNAIADTFSTTEGHAIAGYLSGRETAIIYETSTGVEVSYTGSGEG